MIRPVKPNEIKFLKDMLYEALYVHEGEPLLPRSIIYEPEIVKYIKDWGKPFDCAIVAQNNNELTGAIWGRMFQLPETGYGYIDEETPEISMAVKSNYRGQGIGTKLIEAISQEYLKLNIKAISLSVDKRNKALNLYQRAGFVIVAENGTAWTMKKRLSSKNIHHNSNF
jgi:[ribosomal protein S18]-alanine N-acetyltransferase